jgi:hypothetical protein
LAESAVLFSVVFFGSTEVSACALGSHVFWRPGKEFGFELRQYLGLSGRRFARTRARCAAHASQVGTGCL